MGAALAFLLRHIHQPSRTASAGADWAGARQGEAGEHVSIQGAGPCLAGFWMHAPHPVCAHCLGNTLFAHRSFRPT